MQLFPEPKMIKFFIFLFFGDKFLKAPMKCVGLFLPHFKHQQHILLSTSGNQMCLDAHWLFLLNKQNRSGLFRIQEFRHHRFLGRK